MEKLMSEQEQQLLAQQGLQHNNISHLSSKFLSQQENQNDRRSQFSKKLFQNSKNIRGQEVPDWTLNENYNLHSSLQLSSNYSLSNQLTSAIQQSESIGSENNRMCESTFMAQYWFDKTKTNSNPQRQKSNSVQSPGAQHPSNQQEEEKLIQEIFDSNAQIVDNDNPEMQQSLVPVADNYVELTKEQNPQENILNSAKNQFTNSNRSPSSGDSLNFPPKNTYSSQVQQSSQQRAKSSPLNIHQKAQLEEQGKPQSQGQGQDQSQSKMTQDQLRKSDSVDDCDKVQCFESPCCLEVPSICKDTMRGETDFLLQNKVQGQDLQAELLNGDNNDESLIQKQQTLQIKQEKLKSCFDANILEQLDIRNTVGIEFIDKRQVCHIKNLSTPLQIKLIQLLNLKPDLNWTHLDNGVLKILKQLYLLSQVECLKELDNLQKKDFTKVGKVSAFINKSLNNKYHQLKNSNNLQMPSFEDQILMNDIRNAKYSQILQNQFQKDEKQNQFQSLNYIGLCDDDNVESQNFESQFLYQRGNSKQYNTQIY